MRLIWLRQIIFILAAGRCTTIYDVQPLVDKQCGM